MQIVTAATTFANGGVRLQPHIVKKVVSADGRVLESRERTPVVRVLSPETARAMLLMMEQATTPGGTATRTRIDGVRMSAKTGTAQVFNVNTGRYSDDKFIASCLALFPTDDPRMIVYVVITYPKAGQTYGGIIAAPVVRRMSKELIDYFGIPRSGDTIIEHPGTVSLHARPRISIGSSMPDMTGYSKREVLPLLQMEGVKVTIRGEGWVVHQVPAPGTPISNDTVIEIDLE